MPTTFPMSNPWSDNTLQNAASLYANTTVPINDLAALTSASDGGWVTSAYGSGVVLSSVQLKYRVKNGICYVQGDAKLSTGQMLAATQYNITASGAFPIADGGTPATESIINCGTGATARAIISGTGQLIVVIGAVNVNFVNLAGLRGYLVQ